MKIERLSVFCKFAKINRAMWLKNENDFANFMEEKGFTLVLTKFIFENDSCVEAKIKGKSIGRVGRTEQEAITNLINICRKILY